MKRTSLLFFAIALCITVSARADYLTTFENQGLPADSFVDNAGPGGLFIVDGHGFNNNVTDFSGFLAWSGWALSSKSTTVAASFAFENQYTSATLGGTGGSATYAVAFTYGDGVPFPSEHPDGSFINLAPGTSPVSIDVTNTLYLVRNLSEVDPFGFSRQFAAGDFLRLDIKGFTGSGGTGTLVGEVDFYLANFLGNNAIVVNTWTTLDLTSLAGAQSLRFGLTSSDNDPQLGINTPAYFAVDDFKVSTAAATPEPGSIILLAGFFGTIVGCSRWKRRNATGMSV